MIPPKCIVCRDELRDLYAHQGEFYCKDCFAYRSFETGFSTTAKYTKRTICPECGHRITESGYIDEHPKYTNIHELINYLQTVSPCGDCFAKIENNAVGNQNHGYISPDTQGPL